MLRAVNNLKRCKDLVILPADKGNVTVVMDRSQYDEKMRVLLDDPAYRKLKGDPTSKFEANIKNILKQVEQRKGIDDKMRLRLIPQQATLRTTEDPQTGMPFATNSLSHWLTNIPLAKELARILTPLQGKNDTHVKDSSDFAKWVHEMDVHTGDRMMSFDVVSLFTRVPVDEALEAISALLHKDENIPT
jgi:hypothetical protein